MILQQLAYFVLISHSLQSLSNLIVLFLYNFGESFMFSQKQYILITPGKCLFQAITHHVPHSNNVPVHQTSQNIHPTKEDCNYQIEANVDFNVMFELSTSSLK